MIRLALALSTLLLFSPAVTAQDFRSSISGRVADPAGLGVRDVAVVAVNLASNTVQTAVTSGDGTYTIPFLVPGVYEVRAEMTGFEPFRSRGLTVGTADSVSLHIALAVAGITQTVTASVTRADAVKADRGFSIEAAKLLQLPMSSRNPFMLTTLAPGVTFNGAAVFQRPFDNGAIADWSINGGLNRNNDFLLDGAPNNAIHGGNNIAYVPPVEAVHEVKVVTNGYDAQYGRTGGGVINVTLKSGTNTWHGSIYEFARRGALNAATFLENARGTRNTGHYLDQYGFQLDGPITLGRLYDGRNRTFLMVSAERYREGTPTPVVLTVPDEAQRGGDFRGLRDVQGNLIVIYDPATAREENGQRVRDPFPDNIIPADRIDPVARQLLNYYPMPNTTTPGSAPWKDNFDHLGNVARDSFHNLVFKIDHTLGDGHRMFVRYATNRRTEQRHRNGITEGPAQDGQNPLLRSNRAAVGDWLRAFRRDLLVDVRVSVNHYVNDVGIAEAEGFDLGKLGFPSALAESVPHSLFPRINLGPSTSPEYASLGRGAATRLPTTAVTAHPNVTLVRGASSWRAGLDARWTWYSPVETGFASMRFDFDRTFTRRTVETTDATSGNAVAALLLGAPTAGILDINMTPHYFWRYYAPWLQHDWHVSDHLSVNAGVRWDVSLPVLERDNRLNRDFDPATGGLRFVGTDGSGRAAHRTDWNNIQPRVGAAYSRGDVVIRGGWGRFYLNPVTTGTSHGFSVQRAVTVSEDGLRTSVFPLSNPFPDPIAPPPGRSLGAATLLGASPSFSNPDFVVPYVDQFSIGVGRDLSESLNVEAAYVGSRTRQAATTWAGFNEPSAEFVARCDATKGGSAAFCREELPNPYFEMPGFEGTAHFTSPTLSRYELARPYPQFGAFAEMDRNDGRVWYDSLQLSLRQRAASDFTVSAAYTLSRTVEELGYRDPITRVMDRSPATTDRPHRFTGSFVYTSRVAGRRLAGVLSGWTLAGTVVAQSGRPWDLPGNVTYTGDARAKSAGGGYLQGVAPCVGQVGADGAISLLASAVAWGCDRANFIISQRFAERTTPFRTGALRLPPYAQVDASISRTLRLGGRAQVQLRVDALNALNTPAYDERQYVNDPESSEFGRINRNTVAQSNFPRQLQLGFRLLF